MILENFPRFRKVAIPFLLILLSGAFFLLFRSTDLASDGNFRSELVAKGDVLGDSQFAGWQHFLQVPLARALLVLSNACGWGFTPVSALITFGLLGNFLTLVFVFLAVENRFRSTWAAWAVALTLSFSPVIFFFWNGETANLALGFSFLALYLAISARPLFWVALALAFAGLSRIDVLFIAPGLVWLHGRFRFERREIVFFIRRLAALTILTTALGIVILYISLLIMGVIDFHASSVAHYIQRCFGVYEDFIVGYGPVNTLKAVKGMISTLSPSIHSLSELLRGGRGFQGGVLLLAYAAYAVFFLGCILSSLIFMRGLLRKDPPLVSEVIGAALLILPVQIIFNWRFGYQTEEYHAGSLVGLSWLLAVVFSALAYSSRGRRVVGSCLAVFTLGFFLLYVLPARRFPADQDALAATLLTPGKDTQYAETLLLCDSELLRVQTLAPRVEQIALLRILAEPGGGNALAGSIASRLQALVQAKLAKGKVFMAGNRCHLGYLTRLPGGDSSLAAALEGVDFDTLAPEYRLRQVEGGKVPLNWYNQYDPISWRYEPLYQFAQESLKLNP